jgi:hypothetical protein
MGQPRRPELLLKQDAVRSRLAVWHGRATVPSYTTRSQEASPSVQEKAPAVGPRLNARRVKRCSAGKMRARSSGLQPGGHVPGRG